MHLMQVKHMRRAWSGVVFDLAQLTKTSRPGKQHLLFYPRLHGGGRFSLSSGNTAALSGEY